MIKTIRDSIVSILGDVDDIKNVYKYPVQKADGYPYAWVIWKRQSSSALNNVEDSVIYEYEINLIQEKIEEFKGREEAEDTTMDRVYDICEAFREKNALGLANVIRTMPISVDKSYAEGATRIALKIILAVQTKETISL